MVVHNTLVGTELHYPLGHSTAGALNLINDTTGAYIIQNLAGSDLFVINTTIGSQQIIWGNASTNPTYQWLGSGTWSVGGGIGSSGQVLTSSGAGAAPTWTTISTGGITGTTNLTWTVNSDASQGSDEDPEVILLGGNGATVVRRSRFVQDSSTTETYYRQDTNTSGAGFVANNSPVFGIGTPGVVNGNPTLRFHSGTGAVATTCDFLFDNATISISKTVSVPGAGTDSIRMGDLATAAGTNASAYGRGSTATGNNSVCVGYGARADGTGSITVGASSTSQSADAILIGFNCDDTVSNYTNILVIGTDGTAFQNDTALIGTITMPLSTWVLGQGNTMTSGVAPADLIIRMTNAAGNTTAAGNLYIQGSRPTNSSTGGHIFFQTATSSGSDGVLGTLATRLELTDDGTASFSGSVPTSPGSGSSSEHWGASSAAAGNSGTALGNAASASANGAIAIGEGSVASHSPSLVIASTGGTSAGVGSIVFGSTTYRLSTMYIGPLQDGTPTNGLLRSPSGLGADIGGARMDIFPGAGTGAGTPGSCSVYTTSPGVSSSTLQSNAFERTKVDYRGDFMLNGRDNGQSIEFESLTEETTLSGATTDTSIQIPAFGLVSFVTIYITETITGCASLRYGINGDDTRFGSALALSAGTTHHGPDSGGYSRFYTSATAIRFTAFGGGGTFSAGKIRVTIHYIKAIPPTS